METQVVDIRENPAASLTSGRKDTVCTEDDNSFVGTSLPYLVYAMSVTPEDDRLCQCMKPHFGTGEMADDRPGQLATCQATISSVSSVQG